MATSSLDYDQLYKIVLVGDAAVGKTNLLAYYTSPDKTLRTDGTAQSFGERDSTIGVEFATMIVKHSNGTRIKAQIWDTAGQERYRAITASHYKRAAGALLVFDVTNRKTFENAKNVWLTELKNSAESESSLLDCLMLCGNKIDLTRQTEVTAAEQEAAATSLGLSMGGRTYRTSARTGENVDRAFEDLILRVYDQDRQKTRGKITREETIKLKPNAAQQGSNASTSSNTDCC